jgi:hypothetical protein
LELTPVPAALPRPQQQPPLPEAPRRADSGSGDDTSDDLDLLNPLAIPKPLEAPARSFRMSDSDAEPVGDSFLARSTRVESAPEEAPDSPVRLNPSISRLARELRDAAAEVRQGKRRRRLEFGSIPAADAEQPRKARFRQSQAESSSESAPELSLEEAEEELEA